MTRDDVARQAGVSSAVVSYVLNDGPRRVAPATRERVLRAIAELGYRPNGLARSLRTNRSRALGLVVPDITNAFFAHLSRAVETAAFERGYTLLLGNTMGDPRKEEEYIEVLLDRRVEGVILVPVGRRGHAVESLVRGGVATVVVDRKVKAANVAFITVDNEAGGYAAMRHLLGHGHRRIGCLAGPEELSVARDRRRGAERALREAGVPVLRSLFASTPFSREAAYASALRLLQGRRPPSAIFACADEQALGVYRAAAEVGCAIPHDLAVVSFDSADQAPFLVPPLTAVRQPIEDIAVRAVQRILDRLSGVGGAATNDVFPTELVVRSSCGCSSLNPKDRNRERGELTPSAMASPPQGLQPSSSHS